MKVTRPKECQSITRRIKTGCGSLYVTIGSANGSGPIEVFAVLGKAGGCSNCQNEALTRSVSLGLKYGIPVLEYIDELRGLRCPSPVDMPGYDDNCLSCADAIAKVLKEYTLGQSKNP